MSSRSSAYISTPIYSPAKQHPELLNLRLTMISYSVDMFNCFMSSTCILYDIKYLTDRRLQNAARTRRCVQSQYETFCLHFRPLRTTPPSGPGQRAIRGWTGKVQNQDRASSKDVMLVDNRPSGLLIISPTMTLILSGLHLGLPNIMCSNLE